MIMTAAGPDEDDLLGVWTDLLDVFVGVHRGILDRVARQTTVAASWFPVVVRLLEAPRRRLPMSTLSAHLSMTSGGFTKLADRIENAGLIARVPSAEDRRVVFAALTESGTLTAQRAAALAGEQVRSEVLTRFTPAELADIRLRMRALRVTPPTG